MVILLFINSNVLFGKSDTLSINTDTVSVIAKKYSSSHLRFTSNSIITKTDIEDYSTFQLSEILNQQNSTYIRDYGGLGGMKSISVRGSSSSAVSIILDGIKLNSAQNGFVDLGNLSLNNIKSMELIKGGVSAFYGANSLSGALIINTEDIIRDQIKLSYGNYSQSQIFISKGLDYGNHKFGITGNILNTNGKFPFKYQIKNKTIDTVRSNGDYLNANFGTHYGYSKDSWKLFNKNYFRYSNRGIPGAVLTNKLESTSDRLNEKEYFGIFGIKKIIDESSNLNLSMTAKYNKMNYKSSFIIGNSLFYENSDFTINLDYNKYLKDLSKTYFSLRVEFGKAFLNGDNFDLNNNSIERNIFAISSNIETEIISNSSNNVNSFIGIRLGKSDKYDMNYSPFISIIDNYRNIKSDFKLSYSKNYRLPNFNELYYFQYGNKDLKPENGHSFNLEFNNHSIDNLKLSSNIFYETTTNKIESVARSPIVFSIDNIGKTNVYGIDFNTAYSNDDFNITINYTYQEGKNNSNNSAHYNTDLVYMPNHLFSTFLGYKFYDFNLGIDYLFNSERYYLPGSNSKYSMPIIHSVNSIVYYTFEINNKPLKLKLDIKNILDNQNEFIQNYPTPGRHFILSCLIHY